MRRILKAQVKYLSLCPKGANGLKTLYKEDAGQGDETDFSARMMTKAQDNFDEKGELLAVVYAPDMEDAHGEYAPAEVIREAMHGFLKEGEGIDIRHNEQALSKDDAYVAESFEIQKGDERFSDFTDYNGNKVDVTGGWGVMLKIDNPEIRKLYKEGEWQGISMGGSYLPEMEKADEDTAVKRTMKALARVLGLNHAYAHQSVTLSGDIDMTGEELTKTLEANNEKLSKSIVDGLSKALGKSDDGGKADPPADKGGNAGKTEGGLQAPLFKGDPTDLKAVRAHREAMAKFNLAKEVDWNDPASIEKYETELAKLDATQNGDGKTGDPTEQEIARLQKKHDEEIAALRKSSNQVPDDGVPSDLSKEDRESFKAADAMRKHLAERNGYATAK